MITYQCVYCKNNISKDYFDNNLDYNLKNKNSGEEVIPCPTCGKLLIVKRGIYSGIVGYILIDTLMMNEIE